MLRLKMSALENIPSGNPAGSDENITAIWFFVKLALGLEGMALAILLVECVLGYRWVERVRTYLNISI